jgi:hypothetical protein
MKPTICLLALGLPLAAQSSFLPTRHAGLPPLFPAMIASGDLDGDGDLDLAVANDFGPIQLLLNDGNGRFVDGTAGRIVSPGAIDNHAIDLADIDGDGDLDLLAANEDLLPNLVYRNNGAGVFTDISATALPPNAFDTKNQVIADFDGDGDLDWLTIDFGGCHFYENGGAGVFVDATATRLLGVSNTLGDEWLTMPKAADLDGDGDLDVLAPGVAGLLRNQNGALSPFPTQLPALAAEPHWLADVDGDGDLDLFATNGTRLFLNQGNATFVAAPATALPNAAGARYGCFDVDRDGDVDVFAATGLLLNNGTGLFTFAPAGQVVAAGLQLAAVAADYDGDGDSELPGLPNFLHHVRAPVPPVLGSSYSVELHTRPGAATLGAVFGAFGPGSIALGPWGSLRLDPASAVIVFVQFLTPTPSTVSWALPNVPSLVGTNLYYQAIVDDPRVGLVSTNTFRDIVQ